MKHTTLSLLTTFFLCSMIFSGLHAQCILPSGANCGAGPTLTGTIDFQSGVTLPGTFGGVLYTGISGTVEFDLSPNITITLGDDLTVADGTVLTIIGTTGNQVIGAGGENYTKNGTPDFDDLAALMSGCNDPGGCTVAGLSATLTVALTAWSASANEKGTAVNLEWSSQSENGSDYYFVEHSLDGTNFQELARLGSQGGYNVAADYAYQHTEVKAGTHFYRLGQRDLDGTIALFSIHRIMLTGGSGELTVYPNPAIKGSLINIDQAGAVGNIRLLGLNGQQIGLQPFSNGNGQTSVQLPAALKPGIYLLQTEKGSVRIAVK